ncbi:MAG TPA: AraC family transcriptional regulator [Tepidisphaeraceae bacterium]|jgi:AraC-like DNA-binding protein|nr:AraC family transcriptional regulator [Tepidisphaeraceae bacterium]
MKRSVRISPVDNRIPQHVLRDEVVYRTFATGHGGVRGCAFMRKPMAANSYRDRVMRDYVAVYVLRGTGTFTDGDGVTRRVEAGCFLQMPANRPAGVEQDPDGQWAECWITLDGRFCDELARLGTIDLSRLLLRPGLDLELIDKFERIVHDLSHGSDVAVAQTLARAHELLAYAHDADRRRDAPHPHATLIESASAALSRDLDKRLDTATLAASHGLSYERFRKIFRQRTGISPGEYRIRRRIDRARVLIAQDRLSNKEVAYQLGYADPFTFSKQFKQVVGVSPEMFRRTV